ncbi:MAG: hypothetical protein QGH12_06190, partial [SAR324 cluster bacterium]|nr:hypothetical protein [SAR324 cluster bacterium]
MIYALLQIFRIKKHRNWLGVDQMIGSDGTTSRNFFGVWQIGKTAGFRTVIQNCQHRHPTNSGDFTANAGECLQIFRSRF